MSCNKNTKGFILKNYIITCDNLTKTFFRKEKIFGPQIPVHAVSQLSFQVKTGEFVAFIGPNGGGKSTTVKLLTSILHPTGGKALIAGLNPWEQRKKLCYKIGVVFGQKSQLYYQLPAKDTFYLLSASYGLKSSYAKERIKHLTSLFEIENLINHPVRTLSLGERMRCELVASLIHSPSVLFLDEPTIGLDIDAKIRLREYLKQQVQNEGTTVFLTSHDVADIEQLCSRVLLINNGKLMLDTSMEQLKQDYAVEKNIIIHYTDNTKKTMTVQSQDTNKIIKELCNEKEFSDLTIQSTGLDKIISALYKKTT